MLSVLCVFALGLLTILAIVIIRNKSQPVVVASYADCTKVKGSKVLQTYPEVCVVNGESFVNPTPKATQQAAPIAELQKPKTDEETILDAYRTKKACTAKEAIKVAVKKVTDNGWAEVAAGCEPGSGHLEVWNKINGAWTYIIGFQEGPFCTMVIDKQISHELYPTCITTESGPTSVTDANGNPTIPNQIP